MCILEYEFTELPDSLFSHASAHLTFWSEEFLCYFLTGVMIAWTGIEHFRLGRYDPPPPADEPEDSVVWIFIWIIIFLRMSVYCCNLHICCFSCKTIVFFSLLLFFYFHASALSIYKKHYFTKIGKLRILSKQNIVCINFSHLLVPIGYFTPVHMI